MLHHALRLVVLLAAAFPPPVSGAAPPALAPVVEAEEDVCTFTPADNGAGPLWCHGSTGVVRLGETVFASCIETLSKAKPLNNCLPLLFRRDGSSWRQIHRGSGRTREPCPLAVFPPDAVFLSINPTLTPPDTYGGPARPQVVEFSPDGKPVATHTPNWDGNPAFTEHSYRSFAADGEARELILLQNIGYDHAEWSFRDRTGRFSSCGKLVWPWGADYEKPQHIRTCYPAVAMRKRAVHFCGVSDIIEPKSAWRAYKKELTGRDWDYDFRRLFYTWSDDVTTAPFRPWVEISSREETCGWIFPMDLHPAQNGDVFLLWSERALDERLRAKFFPEAKQRYSLELARIREGRVVSRTAIVEGDEGLGGLRPGDGRFQVTEDGRLFVFYFVEGTDSAGTAIAENRVVEILPDGTAGRPVSVKFAEPLRAFFTATPRAGCRPSATLDLYGTIGQRMRYARVRLW